MVISAIVVSLTIMTIGTTISQAQDINIEPEDTSYDIQYLEDEAERLTSGGDPSEIERHNFRRLVEKTEYKTEVNYDFDEDCFDTVLESSDERFELCLG